MVGKSPIPDDSGSVGQRKRKRAPGAGRPKLPDDERRRPLQVRVSGRDLAELRARAERSGTTISTLVARIIGEYLERDEG